jgi:hypothetical protein
MSGGSPAVLVSFFIPTSAVRISRVGHGGYDPLSITTAFLPGGSCMPLNVEAVNEYGVLKPAELLPVAASPLGSILAQGWHQDNPVGGLRERS